MNKDTRLKNKLKDKLPIIMSKTDKDEEIKNQIKNGYFFLGISLTKELKQNIEEYIYENMLDNTIPKISDDEENSVELSFLKTFKERLSNDELLNSWRFMCYKSGYLQVYYVADKFKFDPEIDPITFRYGKKWLLNYLMNSILNEEKNLYSKESGIESFLEIDLINKGVKNKVGASWIKQDRYSELPSKLEEFGSIEIKKEVLENKNRDIRLYICKHIKINGLLIDKFGFNRSGKMIYAHSTNGICPNLKYKFMEYDEEKNLISIGKNNILDPVEIMEYCFSFTEVQAISFLRKLYNI